MLAGAQVIGESLSGREIETETEIGIHTDQGALDHPIDTGHVPPMLHVVPLLPFLLRRRTGREGGFQFQSQNTSQVTCSVLEVN